MCLKKNLSVIIPYMRWVVSFSSTMVVSSNNRAGSQKTIIYIGAVTMYNIIVPSLTYRNPPA